MGTNLELRTHCRNSSTERERGAERSARFANGGYSLGDQSDNLALSKKKSRKEWDLSQFPPKTARRNPRERGNAHGRGGDYERREEPIFTRQSVQRLRRHSFFRRGARRFKNEKKKCVGQQRRRGRQKINQVGEEVGAHSRYR